MDKGLIAFWASFAILVLVFLITNNVIALSEAIHSLFDALVVSLSIYAYRAINGKNYTYGVHRLEVLSALVNTSVVVVGSVISVALSLIYLEFHVEEKELPVILSSFAIALFLMLATGHEDRGVKLHAVSDVVSYVIGGVGALAVLLLGLGDLANLVVALAVVLTVFILNYKDLRDSFYVLMERSPVDVDEVVERVKTVFPGVHHVHVWAVCEHTKLATLHVRENPNITLRELDEKRRKIEEMLKEYNITHVTIQFESEKED
ncbi:MAG: cation diffusion facilitator family transporter [Candidatus Aramenus sp.]|jgi:cobalt-zinc-cadmium efflux system protein|nr:cation diffusion facilitator family transporter [Candidatus Aramenus sp.]